MMSILGRLVLACLLAFPHQGAGLLTPSPPGLGSHSPSSVALNVDYSLFITSCFRNDLIEQLNRAGITRRVPGCSAQVDVRAAVEKTIYSGTFASFANHLCVLCVHGSVGLQSSQDHVCWVATPRRASTCTAGHTIMVSGLTLAFGLLGLLLFKVEFLQALGVGCCIAVVSAPIYTRHAQ